MRLIVNIDWSFDTTLAFVEVNTVLKNIGKFQKFNKHTICKYNIFLCKRGSHLLWVVLVFLDAVFNVIPKYLVLLCTINITLHNIGIR